MAEIFKVVLALLFQAAAAVIALRLLKVARRHPAVLFIVVTGLMMLLRHAVVLFYILSGYSLTPFEQMHETLCLVVSAGIFGMTFWAVPKLLLLVRTRNDLQEKHSAASQIIRDLAIPALVIDRTHTVTHWNRACERLTGIRAEDMIGTRESWRAFYLEKRPILADLVIGVNDRKRVKALYGDSCAPSSIVTEGWEAESYLPLINGGRWISFSAGPLRDSEGTVTGAIEVFFDVTRQRKTGASFSRSASRLKTLHEIVQEIASEKEIAPLMKKTVALLDEKLSITNVSIMENISPNPEVTFSPRIIASSSISPSELDRFSRGLKESGKGLSLRAAREKRLIVTPDVSASPDFFPFVEKSVSELDIPILDGERALGVISVEGYAPFDTSDEELFTILAGHLSSLWRTIDLMNEIKSLALTDQLTGIPNRRALLDRLREEENRLSRRGGTSSVLMIDMKRFKDINDTYGHLMGDSALRASADLITRCLRNCDFTARFGGDEFVVLLPETGPAEAGEVVNRIIAGLGEMIVEGIPLDLSAECGLASFPEDGRTLISVLKAADDRMYDMKKTPA